MRSDKFKPSIIVVEIKPAVASCKDPIIGFSFLPRSRRSFLPALNLLHVRRRIAPGFIIIFVLSLVFGANIAGEMFAKVGNSIRTIVVAKEAFVLVGD